MKARVITPEHELHGQTLFVDEVLSHGRMFCLRHEGRKIDFGASEVEIIVDRSAARDIINQFSVANGSTLRDSELKRIAERAVKTWNLSMGIEQITGILSQYIWQ